MPEPVKNDFHLRVPFATLLKIALFLLLVIIVIKLKVLLAIIYVAVMVAVVMAAGTEWMQRHHVRRGLGLTVIAAATFAAVLLLIFWVVPGLASELRELVKGAPKIAERVQRQVPAAAPYIQSITAQITSPPQPGNVNEWLGRGAIVGWYAVEAITAIFMTLVIAIYFVIEGKIALAWLFTFAPEPQRRKLVQTTDEIEPVMLAYMRGQLITSTLSGAVALVAALIMHVPAAIGLAVLAFVGDFVPVVGFLVSLVPAVALALLVSPKAAFVIIAAYGGYQLLENYYIVPRIYGKAMRLSTLAVLLSVTVGGMVFGPAGAVLILPLAAAYPAIERIWLRRHLAPDTIPKHDAMASEDEQKAERVADDVMST